MDGPRRAIDLEAPIRFAIILPYAKGARRRRTILRQESGPFSPDDENALSPLPCFLKTNLSALLRKEVIQPQVPLRLPCYDFTPIINHTVGTCLPCGLAPATSGTTDFRGVTGGVYKARERIHRGMLIRDY